MKSYVEKYAKDYDFKEVYDALTHDNQHSNYYMHDDLLYHLGKLCIPRYGILGVIK
jgi:hypothetical protein